VGDAAVEASEGAASTWFVGTTVGVAGCVAVGTVVASPVAVDGGAVAASSLAQPPNSQALVKAPRLAAAR
jgi:hypothetical protein